ncbi:MAG: lipid IV(A) 3-deoxy-D-manno-octulosonic acid transferase [Chromatiales bacterium]
MLAGALRWLYTACLYLAVPFILLRLWRLGFKHGGYRQRVGERFGFIPARRDSSVPLLWLHAVSVGEVQAAVPLLQAFHARFPDYAVLLTTTTPTGAEHARRQFGDGVAHAYFPYDLPDVVARFLGNVQPSLVVLVETELWPNLLRACRAGGIPAVLANARLSAVSARRYRWLRPLTRSMLQDLAAVAAQSEADGERFLRLGLAPARLHVSGSIKFDLALPADFAARVAERHRLLGEQRRVWIAASTHAGEDEIVLKAHRRLTQTVPGILLVLVPRHPARSAWVAELVERCGMRAALRSSGKECDAMTEVLLVDTLGELLAFYGAAEVAFVGGSLVPVGGHNFLEPAVAGVPVITGPHLFNFAEIGNVLRGAGALTEVRDAGALTEEVLRLLRDAEARTCSIEAGRRVIDAHRGATKRLLAVLDQAIARAALGRVDSRSAGCRS